MDDEPTAGLQNRRLAQALRSHVDALRAAGDTAGTITGAVFVVNGNVTGAELYQSHELFRRMWSKLLRTYAIEAIAAKDLPSHSLPPVNEVRALLAAAQAGPAREQQPGTGNFVPDGGTAVYTESVGRDGTWIHRGYLPKLDAAAARLAPDAALVNVLLDRQPRRL
jgi:hypothetical protein